MRSRIPLTAVALAFTVAFLPSTARAQYGPVGGVWTAATSTMTFTFISRDAGFTHDLRLFALPLSPGNVAATLASSVSGTIFSAPPAPAMGTTVTVPVTPGQQYVLGLFVPNNGTIFFSNGIARPPEGDIAESNFQFSMITTDGGRTLVRIEDKRAVNSDGDFDDMIIEVSNVPEPVTMALLGTGLAAMGGAGALRRRRPAA